jgi:hypothetical protein
LDAYKIDILHNGNEMKVRAKVSFKLMKFKTDYNFAFTKVKINLGFLTQELKSPSFVILMSLGVSKGRLQLKGARQPPHCILNSFNRFLEVLI